MHLRKLGVLLVALASMTALLGLGIPAGAVHDVVTDAEGVSGVDNAGDSTESPTCVVDDREQDPFIPRPPTGVVVGNCDNPVPQGDVRAWSLKHKDNLLKDPAGNDGIFGNADDAIGPDQLPGTPDVPASSITRTVPGLEATFTVAKAWPTLGVLTPIAREGDQPLDGLSVRAFFRNPEIESNNLWIACERLSSTDLRKTWIYLPYGGHYLDGYFLFLNLAIDYSGGRYGGKMTFGWLDPNQDGAFFNYDPQNNPIYNPYNTTTLKQTGNGIFYHYSVSGTTITIRMPGVYVARSNSLTTVGTGCKPYATGKAFGFQFLPFARTAAQKAASQFFPGNGQNDQILHVSWQSFLLTRPKTPVPIPLSAIPVLGLSDTDWVIGQLFSLDDLTLHGVDQRIGGYTSKNLMTADWPGPTCNTPTFGGTLPNNPLWIPNQPCAVDSPIGDEWFLTGINFSV